MNHVLLIYKKSIYRIYFIERQYQLSEHDRFSDDDVARLKKAHENHQRALDAVRNALTERGIRFREIYRARQIDYSQYDHVISVGGDGTFIEAARRMTTQRILGVNSDPERSYGNFCAADEGNVADYIDTITDGSARIRKANRLNIVLNDTMQSVNLLNDLLISHQYPAAMSRYTLQIGDVFEHQRGSGLWISTAAGSSGAILAAGGRRIPLGSKKIQYLPRELFAAGTAGYRLTGGVIDAARHVEVRSGMREGIIYVDGPHLRIPFHYGNVLKISASPYPLCIIARPGATGVVDAAREPHLSLE